MVLQNALLQALRFRGRPLVNGQGNERKRKGKLKGKGG